MYLRISEDRSGQELGVARQRADCLRLCADRGWEPVEYVDNDISASTGKPRPAYQQMLSDIEAGALQAVVAWDLDRLHRRPVELEHFMELADRHGLSLATVSGDIDLSTPQGRLVARLKGAVARHEGEHRTARQRAAARQAAERGIPNWQKAFGYLNDGSRQPDPGTAPLVRAAYRAILAGASLGDVARTWNNAGAFTAGGKRWRPAEVSKFLRKPRNAGLRTYGHRYGRVTRDCVVGKGNWPPLVDQETFWAAQAVLDAPGRAPGRKSVRRHLLTGMLTCGRCGGRMGGIPNGGKLTYRCRGCLSLSVRADLIEPLVFKLVTGRLAMPDAIDLLKAEIHDAEEAESLRAQANTIAAELDNIGVERAEGLLTGRQAQIATQRLTDKLAAVQRRQNDLTRVRVFADIPLGTSQVEQAVRDLSPDRFRAVLAVLADITVLPVGKSGRGFNPDRVQVSWR
jgi:DNA invertase Pin-like site-specific DNA recombinase